MSIKKYFGVNFIKSKFDGLDGKTKVVFAQEDGDFKVVCDSSCMKFEGKADFSIQTQVQLSGLAELIGNAWEEHSKLAPKIVRTLSGQ